MWYEAWSESKQRPYYVNTETRETSWAVPNSYITSQAAYDEVAVDENRSAVQKATEGLRKESNRAKRELIKLSVGCGLRNSNLRVLDICCGKGGDLFKWRDSGCTEYVGIDSSDFSIAEARERAKLINFQTQFSVYDARREADWAENWGGLFDVISIQMALHYLFSSEKTARAFFRRAHRACRPGGKMIATFPSCDLVLAILNKQRDPPQFMELETDVRLLTSQKPIPYRFTLKGSVLGVPEFTIPVYLLESICDDTGWVPRHVTTFNGLYHAFIFTHRP